MLQNMGCPYSHHFSNMHPGSTLMSSYPVKIVPTLDTQNPSTLSHYKCFGTNISSGIYIQELASSTYICEDSNMIFNVRIDLDIFLFSIDLDRYLSVESMFNTVARGLLMLHAIVWWDLYQQTTFSRLHSAMHLLLGVRESKAWAKQWHEIAPY